MFHPNINNRPLKSIIRLTAGLMVLCIFGSFLVACSPGAKSEIPPSRQAVRSIRVVSDDNYPPYSFLGKDGKLQGILVDQWRLWEKKTGVKVALKGMDWSMALAKMEAGEFDVIDTIFFNESRAEKYDFTKPYSTINVPIYFNNKISGITGPESIKGFQVAVKAGDAVVDVLKEKGIENLIEFPSYESIIQAAKNDEIVIFAVDEPPAEYFLYLYGIQDRFNKTTPLYSGQFHRAVKKGDTEILQLVQTGFDQISEQEYKAIDNYWFGTSLINTSDLKLAGIIGGVILAILLVLVAWNRTLQYQVGKKTKELNQQESLFRQLAENIDEVFYMRDRKSWRTIYANPTFETIWQRKCEELYANPGIIIDSIHPEDRERVRKAQKDLQVSGKDYDETYRIIRPDGSMRWIKAQMYPVCNEKGAVERFAGVAEDITERMQAEEVLRQNEQRYQTLFDNLGQGICILNNDYIFTYANPAANEIFGVATGELEGQPFTNFLNIDSGSNPNKQPFPNLNGKAYTTEVEITRKDNIHRILQVTARSHRDSMNVPKGILCSFLDITDKKESEAILHASEERFRYIFEQAAVGFGQVDIRTGRFVRVNQKLCDMLGYSREELLKKTFMNITHPDDLGREDELRRQYMERKTGVYSLEKRYIRKNGEIIWVNVTVSAMWEEGDDPVYDIGVVEDITERKKTEAELEKFREDLILAIEGSGVGIWDWIVDKGEAIINDRWAEMIGYSVDEIQPLDFEKFKSLCEKHDLGRSMATIREMVYGRVQQAEFELRMQHKDGRWIWMLFHAKTIAWDENGKPTRITGTQLNISERKRIEEAIREKEFLLRESQRIGHIGSYVMDINEDFWISSPVLDEIFGIDEAHPKTTRTWGDIIHPDDREMMVKYLADYVFGKGNSFDKEYRIVRQSDKAERWVWGRGELSFDHDGKAARMIGTIQDVTDQKSADEILLNTTLELQNAYEATLQGWSHALELRERETAGHSQRVVEFTLRMARQMNFTEDEITNIQRGALLHDIGKMGIPDNILLKPGPLTDEEWVIMRQHPSYAYKLLSRIPYLRPALDIPYYHHERYDGTGYPCGLNGENIPLAARIFTIIDVWDALLSDRPYRPAWSEEAVMKYLKDQAGKQFDPELVDKFLKLVGS